MVILSWAVSGEEMERLENSELGAGVCEEAVVWCGAWHRVGMRALYLLENGEWMLQNETGFRHRTAVISLHILHGLQ